MNLEAWIEPRVARIPFSGCWMWLGAANPRGYGWVMRERRKQLAHRVVFAMACSDIPKGAHVLHKCDVPACVNPAHLFLGSHGDNMKDAARKGLLRRGETSPVAVLNAGAVREIRRRSVSGETAYSMAKDMPYSATTIHMVLKGITWTHIK